MRSSPWLVLLGLAVAAAGCVRADLEPSEQPATPSRAPSAETTPIAGSQTPATPGPQPAPTATFAQVPLPTPDSTSAPVRDDRFTPIDTLTLVADGRSMHLTFVGAKVFAPDDACTARYAAATQVVVDVLEIGLRRLPHPLGPKGCDALGFGRSLDVDLAEPFRGTVWLDRFGPYLHFLAPPPGLVEFALPAGWRLINEGKSVNESRGGWARFYAPFVGAPDDQTLAVYQAFNSLSPVSGGTEVRAVVVNGGSATLYRFPPTGELVLVWQLGRNGLALVADEHVISIAELIAIAELARDPGR